MLVRASLPLLLSIALLGFGPSARGELDLAPRTDVLQPPVERAQVELADPPPSSIEALAQLGCEREDELLAGRLAALDRDLPGLTF